MAKRNVIVRKLSSVETLGCTSVICTDKTGTLTTNQMTAKKIVTVQGGPRGSHKMRQSGDSDLRVVERDVTGTSYDPTAGVVEDFQWLEGNTDFFQDFAVICSLCNNADVSFDPVTNAYVPRGEPTEAALRVLVEKLGKPPTPDEHVAATAAAGGGGGEVHLTRRSNDYWRRQFTPLAELEFSRDRKRMSSLLRHEASGRNRVFTKGAAEVVLARCSRLKLEDGTVVPLIASVRSQLTKSFEAMARQSHRCLGLAFKDATEVSSGLDAVATAAEATELDILKSAERFDLLEKDMVFVGFCGILDPPRPEVRGAVDKASAAGVRVIMITGDSKETASAIAEDVGILAPGEAGRAGRIFSGKEFFGLPAAAQLDTLRRAGNLVFCRAEPQHKQSLIRMLAQCGDVVAMTGDGVNDAPALQQADIGIAMGITGTEVSKNAADMVLADDNFASIVSAIEEGRSIYSNMQTFIFFLVSSNIGEVLSIFGAAMLGLPDLLSPMHLLWVNLVTDGEECVCVRVGVVRYSLLT